MAKTTRIPSDETEDFFLLELTIVNGNLPSAYRAWSKWNVGKKERFIDHVRSETSKAFQLKIFHYFLKQTL